jgi:hypothetical protein
VLISCSAVSLLILNSQLAFEVNSASKQRQELIGGFLVGLVAVIIVQNLLSKVFVYRQKRKTNAVEGNIISIQTLPTVTMRKPEETNTS